jgi:hypothetical protein
MDSWIANLADGSTHVEDWKPGFLSPWQRLMDYCKKQGTYVTNMRMTIGKRTVNCPSNAAGYWQAHGMPAVQGMECDEELHKWRGIGHVENGLVHIIWGARDPVSHNVVFWHDSRSAKNQAQIIWAQPSMTLPTSDIIRSEEEVRNLKAFQDRIVTGS